MFNRDNKEQAFTCEGIAIISYSSVNAYVGYENIEETMDMCGYLVPNDLADLVTNPNRFAEVAKQSEEFGSQFV